MRCPLSRFPVIILAGGLGMRLRPILPDLPKGLAPIGACSFLEIQIKLLRDQGAGHFVLCIGHRGDQVREALGEGRDLGVSIDYSTDGDHLLGTGGALKKAAASFTSRALVLNGDTYFAIDYNAFVQHHLDEQGCCGAIATLALSRVSEGRHYGNVVLDRRRRHIRDFCEKEARAGTVRVLVSAGAYVIEPELLASVPSEKPCSLEREVFPSLLRVGKPLAGVTFPGRFFDIGTPEGWCLFREHYVEQEHGRELGTSPTAGQG